MSDLRLLTIPIFVFVFLGYYTFQIKQGVDRPILVIKSEKPIVVGEETSDFKFSLDRKWKKPSEAGSVWLAEVGFPSPKEGKPEYFICPTPLCKKTAVMMIFHGTGKYHQRPGQDELDADFVSQMFAELSCDKAGNTVSWKFSIAPALGYRFSCQTADSAPLVMHFVSHGDSHFFVSVVTIPSMGANVETALADEVVSHLAAVN